MYLWNFLYGSFNMERLEFHGLVKRILDMSSSSFLRKPCASLSRLHSWRNLSYEIFQFSICPRDVWSKELFVDIFCIILDLLYIICSPNGHTYLWTSLKVKFDQSFATVVWRILIDVKCMSNQQKWIKTHLRTTFWTWIHHNDTRETYFLGSSWIISSRSVHAKQPCKT